jgi:CheY-like chemotaxis protein
MPQMNGIEAAAIINQLSKSKLIDYTPSIILVTGADLDSILRETENKVAVAGIITKPVHIKQLKQVICSTLHTTLPKHTEPGYDSTQNQQ